MAKDQQFELKSHEDFYNKPKDIFLIKLSEIVTNPAEFDQHYLALE